MIYILLDDTEKKTGTYFIRMEIYKSMQLGINCFHFLEFLTKGQSIFLLRSGSLNQNKTIFM